MRSNLETVAAMHGAEHPFTLGMTMNLGLLLGSLGKVDEAASLYTTLEETQVARAVARLATEEAGMAPEVADFAARLIVRWRRSAELCVEALERKE